MIAIFVFIVSFTAIQCQQRTDCDLITPYTQSNGIQVFYSNVKKASFMYKNGNEWKFTIEKNVVKLDVNTFKPISNDPNDAKKIVNRFGGYDYDCDVRYQSDNISIITICTDRTANMVDMDSKYSPKSIIFRASNKRTNDWVIIFRKNVSKISCYSTKATPKLVTDRNECLKNLGIVSLFLDSMEENIKRDIEGIVDFGDKDKILGHNIFFNRKGILHYCSKPMNNITKCKTADDLIPVLGHCFLSDAKPGSIWDWLIYVVIAGVIVVCVWIICIVSLHRGVVDSEREVLNIDTAAQQQGRQRGQPLYYSEDQRNKRVTIVSNVTHQRGVLSGMTFCFYGMFYPMTIRPLALGNQPQEAGANASAGASGGHSNIGEGPPNVPPPQQPNAPGGGPPLPPVYTSVLKYLKDRHVDKERDGSTGGQSGSGAGQGQLQTPATDPKTTGAKAALGSAQVQTRPKGNAKAVKKVVKQMPNIANK